MGKVTSIFNFLDGILPVDGYICLARPYTTKSGQSVFKHYVTSDLQEAVLTARAWDQEGHNVYYSMASLKEPKVFDPSKGEKGGYRYRTKGNMNKLGCVFLELDVIRPGSNPSAEELERKYADRGEAIAATKEFCKAIGWPLPTVVDSGWGFHLYWPLVADIEPGKFEVLAKKLKVVAKKAQYKLDPACTDMSRVFRVPGTHNRKDEDQIQQVRVVREAPERVEFNDLMAAVDDYIEEHSIALHHVQERKNLPDYLNFGDSNTSDYPDEPLDIEPIKEKCGAVMNFFENKANVSYHYWMHTLQLLRFCEGGRELCHEASEVGDNYDEDTTDKVLNSFEEKDIPPPLCDTMAAVADACATCPYRNKIRSPAALGRDAVSFKKNAAQAMQAATGTMPDPPFPFKMEPGKGVMKLETDKDGVETWKQIFRYDMEPIKRVFSEKDQREVTLWRTNNPADGFVEIEMPAAALYDKRQFQAVLADCGVYCDLRNVDDLRHYMVGYVQEMQQVFTKEMLYSRMGWRDDDQRFVYAGKVYDGQRIRPCEMERHGRVVEAVGERGTMEEWRDIIRYFEHEDFAAHQFGIGTAFGSILMPFTGISGSIINIVGESGEGKSTVQKIVNSVWGHPTKLMLPAEAKSSTYNAKISFINQMNSLPICAEEITNATPEEMGSLAYAITQGSEKWRADIKGSVRESQGGWCTTMLCSSNSSMHEKMHNMEGASAKALRIFEYRVHHVKQHTKAEFRQGVDMALMEHYGHAGEIYLQHVMANIEQIREQIKHKMLVIDNTYDMKPEERVWTAAIATNLVGLEIAKELGLHNFNMDAIHRFLTLHLAHMRGSVTDLSSTPTEQLARFFSENLSSMLVVETQGKSTIVLQKPRDKLFVRYDINKPELLVSIPGLKAWAKEEGISYSKLVSELVDQGLVTDKSRRCTLGSGADIPSGQSRVLTIDSESPAFSGTLRSVRSITPNTQVG